jgi:hypothetical protein
MEHVRGRRLAIERVNDGLIAIGHLVAFSHSSVAVQLEAGPDQRWYLQLTSFAELPESRAVARNRIAVPADQIGDLVTLLAAANEALAAHTAPR